jgi:hypothetical protein
MFGAEQFLGPVACQVLHHVAELTTAVVTLARISFGILVGKHRTRGLEHCFADKILRGD